MIQGNLVLKGSAVPESKTGKTSGKISMGRKKVNNRIRALAEAIILQAIEDLFDSAEKQKSMDFFKGEYFTLCSDAAGLSIADRTGIIRMIAKTGSRTISY